MSRRSAAVLVGLLAVLPPIVALLRVDLGLGSRLLIAALGLAFFAAAVLLWRSAAGRPVEGTPLGPQRRRVGEALACEMCGREVAQRIRSGQWPDPPGSARDRHYATVAEAAKCPRCGGPLTTVSLVECWNRERLAYLGVTGGIAVVAITLAETLEGKRWEALWIPGTIALLLFAIHVVTFLGIAGLRQRNWLIGHEYRNPPGWLRERPLLGRFALEALVSLALFAVFAFFGLLRACGGG